MMTLKQLLPCLALLTLVTGCPSNNKPPPKADGNDALGGKKPVSLFGGDERLVQPSADATPDVPYLIQIVAFKITVPAGACSRSDEFWRHVDERAVDVGTYETLYKNGVRCGIAATGEWDYFKGILEQNPAITTPSAYTGREAKQIEMEMKLKVDYQNIFAFDRAGDLVGQTYERCDNLIRVSFQPAPRKPGVVRLGMVPVVKALREVWVPTGSVNGLPWQVVRPEKLYEMNLTADVPMDSFLVVAPSPEGRWPSSLGNAFFVNDGATEQTETVLIFRPIVFRQKVVPTTNPIAPPPR
jgi:hypothetical protein